MVNNINLKLWIWISPGPYNVTWFNPQFLQPALTMCSYTDITVVYEGNSVALYAIYFSVFLLIYLHIIYHIITYMTSCNCIFRFMCGFGASIQTCSSTWVLLWWEHSVQYICITLFQAFSYTYPIKGYLSQQPNGYNHGQVTNLSQG